MNKKSVFSRKLVKKGQSLVELAITILILLMLVCGIADFGMAFFSYISIRDASAEGALFGSVNPVIDSSAADGHYAGTDPNTTVIVDRIRRSSTHPVNLQDVAN